MEVAADEAAGDCPRCQKKLESLTIGTISLRECVKCGGFWMNVDTFEDLCTDKEQQSAVLGFVSNRANDPKIGPPVKYIPCPDCKQLMNRSNFARVSGVIIDLCKQHGVWFDANELQKIIDFIENGGLARAREKQKIALDDELSRIRDEQRKLQLMERRSGGGTYVGDADRSSKFGDVIAALFGL